MKLSQWAAQQGIHYMTAWRWWRNGTAHGRSVDEVVTEIGSGLNGRRRTLLRLLADPTVPTIIVAHPDRLARFGVEVVNAALEAQGRRIIVVDPDETTDDLGKDMLEVLTSFCGRLAGAVPAIAPWLP